IFHDISPAYKVVKRTGITDSKEGVLKYAERGPIWGLRGLSPGSQKIFALTEGERIRSGLSKQDVTPCVTSLRAVPRQLRVLSHTAFQKHFVEAGERCWLIRSDRPKRSEQLNVYLESVPPRKRSTFTCRNQQPWFKYQKHPKPQVLF